MRRAGAFALSAALLLGASCGESGPRGPSTSSVRPVTDETFDAEVAAAGVPVLIDFYATWCGPCKAVAPTLEEISRELTGKLKVVKVDIDASTETAAAFGVTAVPTLVLLKGGKEVLRIVGARSKGDLLAQLRPHL